MLGVFSKELFRSRSRQQLGTKDLWIALQQRCGLSTASDRLIQWVFLGPPGVGKGTYASRAAKQFGIPHIATGDLIRAEIKSDSDLGQELFKYVNYGKLVPDEVTLEIFKRRLEAGEKAGEAGFILDGFPRTMLQAEQLLGFKNIQLALNLQLREEVLIAKCLGRRSCQHCGKSYNLADIYLPAGNGRPEIVMPPLSPPPECAPHLEKRDDDTEDTIRRRLEVYKQQAAPVEAVFRKAGVLLDFELTHGIPYTLPHLLDVLRKYVPSGHTATTAATTS